jgi:hypothetical protein
MRKRNLIYAHEKSVAASILSRLNVQQYYVQTSFTKFRLNYKRKCCKYKQKLIDVSRLSMVISWQSFTKLAETPIELLSKEFNPLNAELNPICKSQLAELICGAFKFCA